MNIICNNCVGARIYERKKEEYLNPFMWCLIPSTDFITLINEYDLINFENVVFNENTAIIDNKINVVYVHYKKGDCDTPTKIDNHVYFKNIEQYVREKYFSRLKRMIKKNEPPIFIISDKKQECSECPEYLNKYDFNDFSLLDKIQTKYKCLLITGKKIKSNKIKVLTVKNGNASTGSLAGEIIDSKFLQ